MSKRLPNEEPGTEGKPSLGDEGLPKSPAAQKQAAKDAEKRQAKAEKAAKKQR